MQKPAVPLPGHKGDVAMFEHLDAGRQRLRQDVIIEAPVRPEILAGSMRNQRYNIL